MLSEAWNSLIGVTVVACVLAAASLALGASRRSFLAGLGAAFAAHLIALSFALALALVTAPAPQVLLFGSVGIEEIARIAMLAFFVKSGREESGLIFGLGFGTLEGVTKFADLMLYISQSESGLMRILAAAGAPAVPWLLHIMLSVVAMFLRRAGLSWPLVFLATAILHTAHNASVLLIVIEDYETLLLANLLRGAILTVIFAGALIWSKSLSERRRIAE